MNSPWTIQKLLTWSTTYLTEHGSNSPRLDSELLLSHSLGIKRLDLYLQFDRPLLPNELQSFKSLIKRRSTLEPIAYITGKKEFWSLEFTITPDVLIPRPDTEILIEKIVKEFGSIAKNNSIGIEIGVGSGIIAIALLKELPNLQMIATDVSPAAIEIAEKNAIALGVADRIKFLLHDFMNSPYEMITKLLPDKAVIDFIVSNPPYIRSAEIPQLADGVKKHEPHLALDGGSDGLDFYRTLASFAKNNLFSPSFLALEIGDDQALAVSKLLNDSGLTETTLSKDLAGLDRVIIAKPAP